LLRSREKTTMIRVKDVSSVRMEGARVNMDSTMSKRMLSTSCLGSSGG